jgi:YD repeat-containing protein
MNSYPFLTLIFLVLLSLGARGGSVAYRYDELNRLTVIYLSNGSVIEYAYDASGNRTSSLATSADATTSEKLSLADGLSQEIVISKTGAAGATYDWYRNGIKFATTNEPRLPSGPFSPDGAGSYRVIIRESSGAVSVVELMVELSGLRYESWLHHKEGPTATPDAPGLGRMESAMSDGTENILKYGFGKGPHESAHDALPTPTWIGSGSDRRMGIKFQRIFGPLDIAYKIEASGDLSAWRDVTAQMIQVGGAVTASDGLSEQVTFQCPVTLSQAESNNWRYLRIGVIDLLATTGRSETLSLANGIDQLISLATPGPSGASYEWYRNGTKFATTSEPSISVAGFSPADAGAYRVIIKETSGASQIVELMVQVKGLTYESWLRHLVGPTATPLDPGLSRMESARDDGIRNLLKYAFGRSPLDEAHAFLPEVTWLGTGINQRLGIKIRRIFEPTDITYRIEASGDMTNWRDVTTELTSVGAAVGATDGQSEAITLQCPVTLAQAESQNWRYLRVAVTDLTPSSPTVLLSDDFNDGTIDTAKWTAMGNTVQEQDGYLKLLTNQTDAGGKVYSNTFSMPANGLTLTRKARVHYSNTYSIPSIRIGYKDEANQEMTVFSILYGNMSYDAGVQHSVHGTFLGLGQGNPHDDNLRYLTVEGPSVLWDTWFDEKITYDRQSGLVRYFRNGVEAISGTAPVMPSGASVYVTMNGWGWYTGHWHHCDDLLIKSGVEP